jgi:uncharacterized protein (UPF0303 family)
MKTYEEMIKFYEDQEKELQFTEFTNETALKIGLRLIDLAKKDNLSITIDITRSGHQLFHYSFEGTSPDNDQWILKKNRTVNRFHVSSAHMGAMVQSSGQTLEQRYGISTFDYAPYGGAVPIIIKNVGAVGTITISGLPGDGDHDLVVQAIKENL